MKFAPYCFVIVGAPGTGKTSQIRLQLTQLKAKRRLIFDPMGDLADLGERVPLAKLQERMRAPAFSLVVTPRRDNSQVLRASFDFVCKRALEARNLLLAVDELADVTSPNPYLVPESWTTVMRQQRHYGLQVIAGSQRPAEIDKRIWSFATRIRAGRLNTSADVRELANVLMVDAREVSGLVDRQWIERDKLTGQVRHGVLEWRNNRPVDLERRAVADNAQLDRPGTRDKKIGASKRRLNGRVSIG